MQCPVTMAKHRSAALAAWAILGASTAGALASTARAADTWTSPYPGVEVLRRTTDTPNEIRVAVVELSSPGIRVRATRSDDRGSTVSSFAQTYGCELAANGDFFTAGFVPRGLAVGAGEHWSGTSDGSEESFFGFLSDRTVVVSPPWDVLGAPPEGVVELVSGRELVTIDGQAADYVMGNPDVHPRTAVGVDQAGERLYLAVVDGRSPASVGMTLFELGALMADVGAWQAINLDGGGSSALYVNGEGGIINSPSDGAERVVANHLGVAVLRFAAVVDSSSFEGEEIEVAPGETEHAYIDLVNMGRDPWTPGVTKLAPTPRDMGTEVGGEPHWLQPHRVSTVENVVMPGHVGRFALPITGGAVGTYTQTFSLVEEGVTWFADEPVGGGLADDGITVVVNVAEPPAGSSTSGGESGGLETNGSGAGSTSSDAPTNDDTGVTTSGGAESGDTGTALPTASPSPSGCGVGGHAINVAPLFVLLFARGRRRR